MLAREPVDPPVLQRPRGAGWIVVLAGLVAAATVVNVSRILRYSRSDTELAAPGLRDEARAAELAQAATSLRASVDTAQIAAASVEASWPTS